MRVLATFALVLLAGCGATIRTGQLGVKYSALKKPAVQKEIKAEGFYFKWPWNSYVKYDVTLQSTTEQVDVLTADALHVTTRVTVTYRPDRSRIYELATQIGREYYAEVIRPAFVTIARAEFARHIHNDIAKDSPAIEEKIAADLRAAIAGKPLEVDRISVDHVEFDATLTKAISAKLAMQQVVDQKRFEMDVAERDADIARSQAKGQADATRIRAEGEARSIILKGEAQAVAQAAIAKTLSTSYLQYKAFDSPATRYYFVPTNRNGLPIVLGGDQQPQRVSQNP